MRESRPANPDGVYSALTAYLMLYDRKHFDAAVFKAWVLKDWEQSDSSAAFGEPHRMRQHLQALFDGDDLSPNTPQNALLVDRARRYLSSNPAPRRLYERAMAEMSRRRRLSRSRWHARRGCRPARC